MQAQDSLPKRTGRWLGLWDAPDARPGDVRPLWYNVPKAKYLKCSIPAAIASVGLALILWWSSIHWVLASVIGALTFALVDLIMERSTIKLHGCDQEQEGKL